MTIQGYLTETRFSEASLPGELIFLSGQVPDNHNGNGNRHEQTENVLAQIDHTLNTLGTNKARLPDATIFLKDFADYDSMNEVWDKGLPKGYAPCRTCVQAHLAKPEWRLGIKIIAAKI